MKLYKTIPEAIEIVRTTYKGREYTMGAYQETKDGSEKMIHTITGNALHIYGEQLFHDMVKDGISLWPIDDSDVEGMALMETIFAVPMYRAPAHGFETEAKDLLSSIVEEAENV